MQIRFVRFATVICLISFPDFGRGLEGEDVLCKILQILHQPCQVNPQPTGSCTISLGGKNVDVDGGNSANGTPLQIFNQKKTPARKWSVPGDGTIQALGKCIDVKKSKKCNCSPAQLNDCNGTPTQQWVFLSNGQLKNPHSNKCLDVKDGTIYDGQSLIIFDCKSMSFENQTFAINCKSTPPIEPPPTPIFPKDPQPTGTCALTVAGKCVNAAGDGIQSGTLLDIYECNESLGQAWIVQGDGTIKINDKCMEVENGETGNLAPVQINNCNGSPEQQWVFVTSGQLKNPNSNRCLDVKNALIKDGQPLVIYDCKTTTFGSQTFEESCKPTPPIEPPPTPIFPKDPQPTGTCALTVAGKCVNAPVDGIVSGPLITLLDIYTCNESPGQKWIVHGDGTIKINDKCMEVPNYSNENLTPVQINNCNGSPQQQWVFLTSGQLKNPNSNRCVDVIDVVIEDGQRLIIYDCKPTDLGHQAFEEICKPTPPIEPPPTPISPKDPQPTGTCALTITGKCVNADGIESGTLLDIYACNETLGQKWIVQGDGTIKINDKCMEVENGETGNLAPVQINNCNGSPQQQWVFLTSGQLKNPNSNRCLDVKDAVIEDGQPLIIYDCKPTDFGSQAFEENCIPIPPIEAPPIPISPKDPQPTGTCALTVAGKCVNAPIDGIEIGQLITILDIYTCNESPGQKWVVQGDGTIKVNGECMEVPNGETENSTPVQINNCNGSPQQQWIFLTSGQLKNPNSNKCLDVMDDVILDGQRLIIYDCKPTFFGNQAFEESCKPTPPIEPPATPISPKDPQPTGTCALTVAGKCVNADGIESGTLLDIYACNETLGQKWIVQGDGTIKINDKCMEVENGETGNLAPVQINNCNGSPEQQWVFLTSGQLKNPNSNRCLDVKDAVIEEGQPLIIYDCKPTDFGSQGFEESCIPTPPIEAPPIPISPKDPQPTGTCALTVAGKCVNAPVDGIVSGPLITLLDIYTCNDSPGQKWVVQGDGTIKINEKCMELANGVTGNLARVQISNCNGSPQQQWVFLTSGQLKNPNSNRCLDVNDAAIEDGQPLIIYDCKPTDFGSQAFEESCIPTPPIEPPPTPISRKDPQPTGTCALIVADKCVNAAGDGIQSGTLLDIYECNESPGQKWIVQGDGTIKINDKCMEVPNGLTVNLTPVQINNCNASPQQQWIFLTSGQLKNPNSNRCLDVMDNVILDGQRLIIYDCSPTFFGNQAIEESCKPTPTIEPPPTPISPQDPQPTGTCAIKILDSDQCVDVVNGDSGLIIFSCNGTKSQDWTLQGDGTVVGLGKCMDAGGTENLSRVQAKDCNGTPEQQWVFLRSGQLKNPNSNRCIDVKTGLIQDGQPLIIYNCHLDFFPNQAFETQCKPPP